MKKVLAVVVALLLVFGMVGCKGDEEVYVDFDTRGGVEIDTMTCEKNKRIDLPTPTRDDAIFMGWYTDKSWEHKVEDSIRISENTVLYARWATYQNISLNSTNYTKYFDLSIRYLYTGNWLSLKNVDVCEVICTTKDCFIQDGKNDNRGNSVEKTNIYCYAKGYKIGGEITGWWTIYYDYSYTQFYGFSGSSVSDVEKVNGIPVYNISGTLRAYILED